MMKKMPFGRQKKRSNWMILIIAMSAVFFMLFALIMLVTQSLQNQDSRTNASVRVGVNTDLLPKGDSYDHMFTDINFGFWQHMRWDVTSEADQPILTARFTGYSQQDLEETFVKCFQYGGAIPGIECLLFPDAAEKNVPVFNEKRLPLPTSVQAEWWYSADPHWQAAQWAAGTEFEGALLVRYQDIERNSSTISVQCENEVHVHEGVVCTVEVQKK